MSLAVVPPKTNGSPTPAASSTPAIAVAVVVPPKTPANGSSPVVAPTPSASSLPIPTPNNASSSSHSNNSLAPPSAAAAGPSSGHTLSVNAALALAPNSPWGQPGMGLPTPLASTRSLDELSSVRALEKKEAFKEKERADEAAFSAFFKQSHKLRKYGRDLKRKDITLTMNQDLSSLIWGKGKTAEAKEIEQIVIGRKTPVFQQYDSKRNDKENITADEDLSFSIVFKKRSLDLELIKSPNVLQERNQMVDAFKWLRNKSRVHVSGPFNVTHKTHVSTEFKWSGDDLEKTVDLSHKLGEGAFGTVYRADLQGFEMAIKTVHAKSEEAIADVKHEMSILQSCRNKYIVAYYGCWGPDSKKRLWILMDYCGVGSVMDLVETISIVDMKPTEQQVAFIIYSTLMALVYLNSRKIIHRDVKARNILVNKEGDCKLADFGVSKDLERKGEGAQGLAGSPLWMAPEVISGKEVDYKADIWSVGITAIEMAEKRVPNEELGSTFRVMRAITTNAPPTLKDPHWSPYFVDFLSKCLVKDPKERADAQTLLKHPWLTNATNPDVLKPAIKTFFECKHKREEEKKKVVAAANTKKRGSLLSTVFGIKPKDEADAAKSRSGGLTPHNGGKSQPNTPRHINIDGTKATAQRVGGGSQKKTVANNNSNGSGSGNGSTLANGAPTPKNGEKSTDSSPLPSPARPGPRGSLHRQKGGSLGQLGGLDALREEKTNDNTPTNNSKANGSNGNHAMDVDKPADDDDEDMADNLDDEEVVGTMNGNNDDMNFDDDAPSSTLNSTTRSLHGTGKFTVTFTLAQLRQACIECKIEKRLMEKLLVVIAKRNGGGNPAASMSSPASSMRSTLNGTPSRANPRDSFSSRQSATGITPLRNNTGATSKPTPGRRTSLMMGNTNPSASISGAAALHSTMNNSHPLSSHATATSSGASLSVTQPANGRPTTPTRDAPPSPGGGGNGGNVATQPAAVPVAIPAKVSGGHHVRRPSLLAPGKKPAQSASSGSLTARPSLGNVTLTSTVGKPLPMGTTRPSSAAPVRTSLNGGSANGSQTARPTTTTANTARPKVGVAAAPKRPSTGTATAAAPSQPPSRKSSASLVSGVEPSSAPTTAFAETKTTAAAVPAENSNGNGALESDVKKSSSLLNLERAQSALNALQRNDFTAIKRMANAPRPVRMAIEGMGIVLGARPTGGHKQADAFWTPAQALLVRPNILTLIKSFDLHSMTPEMFELLHSYGVHTKPDVTPSIVANSSRAAGLLWSWVRAIYRAAIDELRYDTSSFAVPVGGSNVNALTIPDDTARTAAAKR